MNLDMIDMLGKMLKHNLFQDENKIDCIGCKMLQCLEPWRYDTLLFI